MRYYIENFSVNEFKERSQKALERLEKKYKKKNKKPEPVVPSRLKSICSSWWGQVWAAYFEEHYVNCGGRWTRGKKYIRYGAVLDLKIEEGQAKAVVMGQTIGRNYEVTLDFEPLDEERKQTIIRLFKSYPAHLNQLLHGTFPPVFLNVIQSALGLFPLPNEIHINCTCPDHNPVCKHVIAVMYGIGILFDRDPLIFLKLRGINLNDFIQNTMGHKIEAMLQNAHCQSDRILEKEAYDLFGL